MVTRVHVWERISKGQPRPHPKSIGTQYAMAKLPQLLETLQRRRKRLKRTTLKYFPVRHSGLC